MTHVDPKTTIDDLQDLLDRERSALLTGDVDAVARLHDRKAGLITALNDFESGAFEEEFVTLNRQVVRNQALLDAAMAGIKSVSRRIESIRRVRAYLDTYDAEGRKQSVEFSQDASVERRA